MIWRVETALHDTSADLDLHPGEKSMALINRLPKVALRELITPQAKTLKPNGENSMIIITLVMKNRIRRLLLVPKASPRVSPIASAMTRMIMAGLMTTTMEETMDTMEMRTRTTRRDTMMKMMTTSRVDALADELSRQNPIRRSSCQAKGTNTTMNLYDAYPVHERSIANN